MTILKDIIVLKARKRHICDECLSPITVGQSYRNVVHTYDGFCSFKTHINCHEISKILNKDVLPGGFRDFVHNFSKEEIEMARKELSQEKMI